MNQKYLKMSGNIKGRESFGDLGANEDNIKMNLRKLDELLLDPEAWSSSFCDRKKHSLTSWRGSVSLASRDLSFNTGIVTA
jgi:hypothetical protein